MEKMEWIRERLEKLHNTRKEITKLDVSNDTFA
jgi:hypothetical protein